MKLTNTIRLIAICTLINFAFSVSAQNLKKIYLDEKFNIVPEKKATYYKTVHRDSTNRKIWKTNTYFTDDKLYSVNFSHDDNGDFRTGPFWAFFRNGNYSIKGTYCDSTKAKICGVYENYYENGVVKNRTNVVNDEVCGVVEEFYETGILKRKVYSCNNTIKGDFYEYYPTGKLDSKKTYDDKGVLKKDEYFKEDGSISQYTNPEFGGGELAQKQFINHMLVYPKSARRKNIEGKVVISFDVCEDGNVCDFKVEDSPHEILSEEAMRVVALMPTWKPAVRDGVNIRTKFYLPIQFTLY